MLTWQRVVLRQNRIQAIAAVPWLAQLEELDLYDNGIRAIENLEPCTGLQYRRVRGRLRNGVVGSWTCPSTASPRLRASGR